MDLKYTSVLDGQKNTYVSHSKPEQKGEMSNNTLVRRFRQRNKESW